MVTSQGLTGVPGSSIVYISTSSLLSPFSAEFLQRLLLTDCSLGVSLSLGQYCWPSHNMGNMRLHESVTLTSHPVAVPVISVSRYHTRDSGLHIFILLPSRGLREVKYTRLVSVVRLDPCRSSGVERVPPGFRSSASCIFKLMIPSVTFTVRRP